jgi:hypothetical protein
MRCRAAGCSELVTGKYCAKHVHNNVRSNRTGDPFYLSMPWIRMRDFIRCRNPICQRIVNGVRCFQPAAICHHLVGINESVELRLDPRNLVAVCRHHHPDEPTPQWREGIDYSPTVS